MAPKAPTSKDEDLRTHIGRFLKLNPDLHKSKAVNHFRLEGVPRQAIYDILNRYAYRKAMERKPGSGRKAVKMTRRKLLSLKSCFDGKDSIPRRTAVQKFNSDIYPKG